MVQDAGAGEKSGLALLAGMLVVLRTRHPSTLCASCELHPVVTWLIHKLKGLAPRGAASCDLIVLSTSRLRTERRHAPRPACTAANVGPVVNPADTCQRSCEATAHWGAYVHT